MWRRAYVYFDRAHAFARDYILTHGTDITDYEVRMATELWINSLLYSDLKLANGMPHHGVKSNVELGVRAGPVTAYPHPNQPYFNRIGRGMALQVSGDASIGGYGGENYRMFIIADKAGEFDPHMRKLWRVNTTLLRRSVELPLDDLLERGLQDPQIPGRKRRSKIHLPPPRPRIRRGRAPAALSLPWATTPCCRKICVSRKSRVCSIPENGCGFNWSDTVVTGAKSGYRMSQRSRIRRSGVGSSCNGLIRDKPCVPYGLLVRSIQVVPFLRGTTYPSCSDFTGLVGPARPAHHRRPPGRRSSKTCFKD